MTDQFVTKYSFKRKEQAVTLASQSSVKVGDKQLHVDPQLLFQRLIVATRSSDDTEDIFAYELCSHPPALFDDSQMLREPQKSVLAEVIWSKVPEASNTQLPTGDVWHALDGGHFYIGYLGLVVLQLTETHVSCIVTM